MSPAIALLSSFERVIVSGSTFFKNSSGGVDNRLVTTVMNIVLTGYHRDVDTVELKTVITKRGGKGRFRKRRQLITRKDKKAMQIIRIGANSEVGRIFQYSEPKKLSSHKAANIRPAKTL